MPTLIHLPYSPWSERAKWALDARGIEYTRRHYQPLIGEPALRWRLGQWSGPVTVPVLLTDDGALGDSWDIALWADAHGDGPSLFPAVHLEEIQHWNGRSQLALAAGRQLSLRRVVTSPAALTELLPKPLRALGSVGRAVARAGVKRTLRKYDVAVPEDSHRATVIGVLDELRAARGGRPTLLAEFSYADITAAQVLVFVRPPESRFFRTGPANREAFADEDLAAEYADLLAWRDALYERHRPR